MGKYTSLLVFITSALFKFKWLYILLINITNLHELYNVKWFRDVFCLFLLAKLDSIIKSAFSGKSATNNFEDLGELQWNEKNR